MSLHHEASGFEPTEALQTSPVSETPAERPSFYDCLRRASTDIVSLLLARYADDQGRVHAETVIAALAALAGEFALRTTGFPLPKNGTFIAGGVQDGILFADPTQPTAWSMVVKAAAVAGLPEEDVPDLTQVLRRAIDGIGHTPFPPLSIPSEHFPREWPPYACQRFRDDVRAIGESNSLTMSELVVVLGWAIGDLIIRTRTNLPPAISIRLAAEIMIGVSRMAPLTGPRLSAV